MGRYSSGSDDASYKKKKKKRRSRSRSRSRASDSGSYSSSKHSKSKKKVHESRKKSKRSKRSRSLSRSRSRDRNQRSRKSRSRSRSYSRRSPSPSRRSRRSRSRSRERTRRSRSRERRSRSRSPTRKRHSRSVTPAEDSRHSSKKDKEIADISRTVPGYDDMTKIEQAEVRMKLALKAAAAADEKLKEQGVLPSNVGRNLSSFDLTFDEQQKRASAIEDIEQESFVQQNFKTVKIKNEDSNSGVSHESAMFGGSILGLGTKIKTEPGIVRLSLNEQDSIINPRLYVSKEEKVARWRKKLITMRKKKLEGEAMA